MGVRHFSKLFLFTVCGITIFTGTIEAAAKSISIDPAPQQIQGKQTYEKSFNSSINPTESALLFDQDLKKQSSGG